jgi:enamine deaminase RidA (YjgF/YER057c/UK114 family)
MSIQVIKSDVPQPLANYSEASLAKGLVFAAGQLASDFKTGVPPEARKHPTFPFYGTDNKLQKENIWNNNPRTLKAAGTK